METEIISDRIKITWDSFNANVIVDGKTIKKFKNHELAYTDAFRLATDTAIKHTFLGG